jgi:hypothetical protein
VKGWSLVVRVKLVEAIRSKISEVMGAKLSDVIGANFRGCMGAQLSLKLSWFGGPELI